ncbi:MAG: sugar ABC transporter permease [Anaerolineae bacterium]|nr:sugar ABC transporter permease [Candidatus Roseilinea sp.]MDW8450165.1 sugar ABC transporter permease [Anaerolineae bacterium]
MLRTSRFVPYLYLTPAALLLAFTFGYPLIAIFDFSVRRIRGASGPFVGLENYRQVLNDSVFHLSVAHNAQLLLAVPILLGIGLLLAILLYERPRFWPLYRTLLFLPYILAVPLIGVVFSNMLQLNGVINEILRAIGLRALALDWLGSAGLALWSVMGVIIWREVGFGMTLFLARLQSLNEEVTEAARIDGANWWQRAIYVTIPQLRGVIEFYIVVSIITMLAWVFSYVYVMTRGGPGNATIVIEMYLYNFAFRNALPGVASAVAVILFLFTLALTIPLFRLRAQALEEDRT